MRLLTAVLASMSVASAAAAAPFAVTFRNAETVQLVDLATIRRAGASVTYDHIMMVPPNPDLAGGGLSHLVERHEARCADGMVRRRDMGAVMLGEAPELRAPIPDDPWVAGEPGELAAVCGAVGNAAETVTTIEQARKLLGSRR